MLGYEADERRRREPEVRIASLLTLRRYVNILPTHLNPAMTLSSSIV